MAGVRASHSIALCLSGGGLRATLFHLGLIKALRAHKSDGRTALSAVREIYSVSGGSILAAHLVRNWASYNGSDEQFAKMETELLKFAGDNIRDRVIRRWLLTKWLGMRRSHWLQKEYERLLGQGAIGDCYRQKPAKRPPRLYILATSFKTGELCSFGHDRFEIMRRKDGGKVKAIPAACGHLRLSFAVAASSAFPPLFPPIPLTRDMLFGPGSGAEEGSGKAIEADPEEFDGIHLSDGGVYDNLGIEKVRMNRSRPGRKPKVLVVSNAGGSFRTEPRNSFAGVLSRNIRASDILMRRVGENTEDAAANIGMRYLGVGIGTTVEDRALEDPPFHPDTQKSLRVVRTDLDAFGPDLAKLLIDHGCRVGYAVLKGRGWQAQVPPARLTADRPTDLLARVAQSAGRRRALSLALDFRDWTLPILWAIAIVLAGAGAWGVSKALAEQEAREQADLAAKNQEGHADLLDPLREAYADGDYDKLGNLLGHAIATVEATAEDPSRDIAEDPVELKPGEAIRIATQRVDYRLPAQPKPHRQPVYIQFAGMLTRAQITELNEDLKSVGWVVQGPSGERIATAAGLNEVRFSGENGEAAKDLAAAINAAGIVKPVVAVEASGIGPNLEAWISR